MNNRIKVLHLNPEINLTCGVSKSIYSIVLCTRQKYENYVYCNGGDCITKYMDAGINVTVDSTNRKQKSQIWLVLLKLIFFVKRNQIDIIHSHHRYYDLLSYLISKFCKVRTITSVRSKVYGKRRISYKSEVLVACSYAISEHLIKYFGIDRSRVKVIHNFVTPSDFVINISREKLRRDLGIESDIVVVSFIGRLSIKEKGIDILLEAFAKLSEGIKGNVKLLLVGSGEDKDFVEKFILKYKMNALIIPPQENIYNYYNITDIVVLPSRIEPFGNVALEAGLAKKAFIGSNVDGLAEIIIHNDSGFLFPPNNVECLREYLHILINDKVLRVTIGDRLHCRVIENFTKNNIIPKWEMLYERFC